jgi:hypothetical protein
MTKTAGDLWVHRDKEYVWWTKSLDQPAAFVVMKDPRPRDLPNEIYLYHKPCKPWSSKTLKGADILWDAVHPKAKDFLATEATCQKLGSDNAQYVQALINGNDVSAWHSKSVWRDKEERFRKGAVKIFNPKEVSAAAMADSAWGASSQSGKAVANLTKNKDFGFPSKYELERYVLGLIESQEGLCALTGINLQYHEADSDPELRCSLDRIDSDGHYEPGNLQVVCWFANRWKGTSQSADFIRLIELIRD